MADGNTDRAQAPGLLWRTPPTALFRASRVAEVTFSGLGRAEHGSRSMTRHEHTTHAQQLRTIDMVSEVETRCAPRNLRNLHCHQPRTPPGNANAGYSNHTLQWWPHALESSQADIFKGYNCMSDKRHSKMDIVTLDTILNFGTHRPLITTLCLRDSTQHHGRPFSLDAVCITIVLDTEDSMLNRR